jgi:hypothetical protein
VITGSRVMRAALGYGITSLRDMSLRRNAPCLARCRALRPGPQWARAGAGSTLQAALRIACARR